MTRREVKRKMKLESLTQEQIAEQLGVTSAFVTRWFKGKSKSERFDRKLAMILKIPFSAMPGRGNDATN